MVTGYIDWAFSPGAGREFPILVFSADTDMATMGLVTLTSIERCEVVVTTTTGEEWSTYDQRLIESRVNRELGRMDLRCIGFIRGEGKGIVVSDPFVAYGEATCIRTEPLSEFVAAGGIVTELDCKIDWVGRKGRKKRRT